MVLGNVATKDTTYMAEEWRSCINTQVWTLTRDVAAKCCKLQFQEILHKYTIWYADTKVILNECSVSCNQRFTVDDDNDKARVDSNKKSRKTLFVVGPTITIVGLFVRSKMSPLP